MLAFYLIWKLTNSIKIAFIFGILDLFPDLDKIFEKKWKKLKHRSLTHSIFIIPLYFLILFFFNIFLEFDLNLIELVLCSIILFFSHVFLDMLFGKVMIFPNIWVGPIFKTNELELKDMILFEIIFSLFLLILFVLKI